MDDLNSQYEQLKSRYKDIFIEAAQSIRGEIEKFKPEASCKSCTVDKNCKIEKPDIFMEFPDRCPYREWQSKTLSFLGGEYKQKLRGIYKKIMEARDLYSCGKCGACCRLAVSEFSPIQLRQKAMRGDNFAKQFLSVFVPYESEEEARAVMPDYFDLLENIGLDTRNYYYHCNKVVDNLCSDYENRPEICKEFPANPLKLLPPTCSFCKWREEVNKIAMSLQARIDIIDFYKQKLS